MLQPSGASAGELLLTRGGLGHLTPTGAKLTDDQRQFNLVHAHIRARAEQGNAWSKNYRALQKVSLCPWRIGALAAAVLVLHHLEHGRTT